MHPSYAQRIVSLVILNLGKLSVNVNYPREGRQNDSTSR